MPFVLVSLQHHIQIHHANATASSGGGPQIHIPQTDGHKRQYQQHHYHDMPPPGAHHQYPPHHNAASGGYHNKDGLPNGNAPPNAHKSRPQSGATGRKQAYKGIVKQNRRDADMQYVDPPPEFLFNATKDSK